MQEEVEEVSYAEVFRVQLEKIASALNTILSMPLPEELITLYVQKKTKLAKRDIQAVFEAIKELNRKTKRKVQQP